MENYIFKNVSFSYPEQEQKALKDISFSIKQGEFLVLCGPSGCGKSTLLRHLKTCLKPHGVLSGEIIFENKLLDNVDERTQAQKIGFVIQSPENQVVTDKVWHELAFGLESLGYDTPTIRRRVAEVASFFGIEKWFYKNVSELSGGQKQLLSLASVMAMQPSVLVLDEPTAQLDPIAATDFLALLGRINRELGTTVILTEHRLEEAFVYATRVVVMEKGEIICDDVPQKVGLTLKEKENSMFLAMPTAMRVWAGVETDLSCPITVRDGSDFLNSRNKEKPLRELYKKGDITQSEDVALSVDNIWFRYEKDSPDVVKGFSLELKKGDFYALLGGNGTGKTTLLKIINGLENFDTGEIKLGSKVEIGYYDQEHHVLHEDKTLFEEISDDYEYLTNTEIRNTLAAFLFTGEDVFKRIKDLSGGERGRVSLAKLMLSNANFIILDEPTNHLDIASKEILEEALNQYEGTVLYVSHDRYFINKTATRILDLTEKGFENYIGNYDYYLEKVTQREMQQATLPQTNTKDESPATDSLNKLNWQEQKEQQALKRKQENALKKVEQEIDQVETALAELEEKLNDPEIATNLGKLNEITKEQDKLNTRLEELMNKWEELA